MITIEDQTKRLVQRKAEQVLSTLRATYGSHIPMPEFLYDLDGSSGGETLFYRDENRSVVRLNTGFLHHYDWQFVDEVVPHEMCHVGTDHIYGPDIRPHGIEWVDMMDCVGEDFPVVYHNFDIRKTTMRYHTKHLYCCMGCGRHYFETQGEVTKVLNKKKYLHCGNCSRRLTYIQELGKISYTRCIKLCGKFAK